VKNSKKTEQLLQKLDNIEEILYYYMLDTTDFNQLRLDIVELKEFISEYALEKKEYNARFAKKIKKIWDQEHD
jgi:hypothetical protein